MIVTVLGALGNMGKRYTSILQHLGHSPIGIDVHHKEAQLEDAVHASHAIIVATPTSSHLGVLKHIARLAKRDYSLRILCEKPICQNEDEVELAFEVTKRAGLSLYCVNQYNYLPERELFFRSEGPTSYDYYKSGPDGLHWDCFQLFGLANNQVSLQNKSPIWKCFINGIHIDISHMDKAYVLMVNDFLSDGHFLWGEHEVKRITRRISNYPK